MFKQTPFEEIVAIDIETSSKGELLDIGCYTYNDYIVFPNWELFFEHLLTIKENVRVIAHNGFGFDFIGFAQWFLKNRKQYDIADDDITFLSSESLLIAMIIETKIAKYTFLDTMRFFPGQSLQKLAESFLGESKDDVPDDFISRMEDYKREHNKRYYEYLRKDCEILYRIYVEFRKEINDFTEIGEIGMSSGSTAMKSFRRWLSTDYPKTKIFACPQEWQGIADHALRGGLTLYIGDGEHTYHKYENVYHYDVISMYPSVMRSVPVPSSPMVFTNEVVKDFGEYRPGWYLCDFRQTLGRIPILFTLESELPQWEGTAILSHFELQFLDLFGEYEVHEGIVYDEYLFPFEKFIDSLLEIRMQAKRDKLLAKAHSLKILANSLYGKFSQRASREIIAITSDRDYYETELQALLRDSDDSGVTEYAVSDDYVIYGVESISTSFSNRFIGAMVTSLARLKLGVILNTVRSIYCDTDSIFTQDLLDMAFVGNSPGDFEHDEESPATMICLGKKSYQYGNDIKFKGIPSKRINSDDMNALRFDFEKQVEYKSPTAWRTAMKNNVERPNEFLPKSRRVVRGKSLAETGLLRTDGEFFDVNVVNEFLQRLLTLT
jgi:DNA polymerase elongation subunit (family B)